MDVRQGDKLPLHAAAGVRAWSAALRVPQWVKNGFVLVPVVFSGRLFDAQAVEGSLRAFVGFCLAASAVYLGNDVIDRARDAAHPLKRLRPIASGAIGIRPAIAMAVALAASSLGLGLVTSPALAAVLTIYLVLNGAYSVWLKNVVILDVFLIAAFFVLRLLAGAVAISVQPSVWLVLCGGLLALYLGFAKRRHEVVLMGDRSAEHRQVLAGYTTAFLDQVSAVLLAVTVVSYIMYTRDSDTARLVGTDAFTWSAALVLFGVFRYLFLVHRREGGDPTETLLQDRPLIVTVLLWIGYCAVLLYRR